MCSLDNNNLFRNYIVFLTVLNNKSKSLCKKSFKEQYINGTEYSFTHDNSTRERDGFYFQGMVSTFGNTIDALMHIGNKEHPYTIFGDIYFQFIKTSVDVRYYTNTTREGLVLSLYAGTGISYGNSSVMPYVEHYFIGGSNSLRGFRARSLGPGSYKPEEYYGLVDQTGDIKLEFNSEYRFRMTEIMLGALFLEVGNVWLLNPDENRPGAQFKLNNLQLEPVLAYVLISTFLFFAPTLVYLCGSRTTTEMETGTILMKYLTNSGLILPQAIHSECNTTWV